MAIFWALGRNANFLMSKCVDHQFEFTPYFDLIVILAPKNHDIKAQKLKKLIAEQESNPWPLHSHSSLY